MVKNKNDKRFLRSKEGMEKKYLAEVKRLRGVAGVKAQAIYRGAKVNASTFFRHYRNFRGMVGDVRSGIISEYNETIRKVIRHSGKFYDIVYETFKFVERHREYFETAITTNNTTVFERIGKKLWKYVKRTEYRYGMKRIELVYTYEVIGVLMLWVDDEKCNTEKIDQYVTYIMKISSGGINHLSLFADKK